MNRKIVLAVVVASYGMWSPTTSAGPVTSLDDIRFWVGSGEHRAALAIDWNDTTATDASLVWGSVLTAVRPARRCCVPWLRPTHDFSSNSIRPSVDSGSLVLATI